MVNLAPALLEQGSSLDFHVVAFILDDVVQRTVNAVGLDVDELLIVNAGITSPAVYLRALRNVIVIRVVIKIQQTVFNVVCRVILKHRRNIIVEVNPIFTIQEEHADSDQIGHILVVILPVDVFVLVWLLTLFADDLLQQMPGLFRPVTIRVDARLFNIVQVIIHKILADLL